MTIRLVIAFALAVTTALSAEELPRKATTPRESYPNVDVIYDSIKLPTGRGERLRTIATKPRNSATKLPDIFVVGWLSCDSFEAPAETKDATGLVLRELAQAAEWSLFRVDKPGVGDSEGVCSETDFATELGAYRLAFIALKNYDFIDSDRIYILGISNGGGFAPTILWTPTPQVRGYISVGGWVKTWFEHMLEIERRRFTLMGKTPSEVTNRMKCAERLYFEWLINHRRVADIVRGDNELAEIWPGGTDLDHLYGRPLKFYEQLQEMNLAGSWSHVNVPTLLLHGQFDWIMSREDPELIAQYVNANKPGAARFVDVPEMGHTFQHYRSMADAFADKTAPFDSKNITLVTSWLKEQLKKQ
jgi:pimeloyl-ACP methyl ester carboxylesterase